MLCAFELIAGFGRKALTIGIAAVLVAAGLAAALILLGAAPADYDSQESLPPQHGQ